MHDRFTSMTANMFHAGATCPFCQETLSEGQSIVKCQRCGSLHHETCWSHNNGCSSYHCDEKVRINENSLHPDLVITDSQVAEVSIPVQPARKTPAEAVKPFLEPKAERQSKLATAALALAGLTLTGVWGIFAGSIPVISIGAAIGLSAVLCGVIAMVSVNVGRKVSGAMQASAAVALASVLILVYFTSLSSLTQQERKRLVTNLELEQGMPSEDELNRMDAAKATALRANVVIEAGSPTPFFAGELSYGSGIILRVDENRTAAIMTNKHVVQSPDGGFHKSITVLFYNGEKSEASVAWEAPGDADLVILTCQGLTLGNFKGVRLASSVAAHGQAVFAVGNPLNLGWSYTEGVISSVRHRDQADMDFVIYQTQTPINRGNSGGGLYDMEGRLIGVNTWTQDKAIAEGLSFVISSKSILDLMDDQSREEFLGTDIRQDESL